tara:strand:- start:708 stop:914 length:207 start_codon:yes stop_codon:yes gene_type:complete
MKLIIIMWVFSLASFTGEKSLYNGNIENCLQEALLFNKQVPDFLAGCYVDAVKHNKKPEPKPKQKFNY